MTLKSLEDSAGTNVSKFNNSLHSKKSCSVFFSTRMSLRKVNCHFYLIASSVRSAIASRTF